MYIRKVNKKCLSFNEQNVIRYDISRTNFFLRIRTFVLMIKQTRCRRLKQITMLILKIPTDIASQYFDR